MGDMAQSYPKLEASSFDNWLFRVKCLLDEKQIKYVLESKTTEKSDEKYEVNDAKAKCIIVQCLTDKHLNIIKECNTAQEMVKVLEDTFQRKSIMTKIHLRRKLLNVKHEKSEKLEEYFARFDTIVRELECTGENVEEKDKVCYILTGLEERYDSLITAIETINTDIKLEYVKARLLDEELKMKNKNPEHTSEETAFPNIVTCYRCNKPGHIATECRGRGRGQRRGTQFQGRGNRGHGRGRGHIARGQGYQYGHYSQEGQRHASQQGSSWQHTAATASEENKEFSFIAGTHNDNFKNNKLENCKLEFIVDSGCTEHLIQSKYERYMSEIQYLDKEVKIFIANGDYVTANKRGNIYVTSDSASMKIDALILESLSFNLLSVRKIVQNDCEVRFNSETVEIQKNNNSGNKIIGYCSGKLYKLHTEIAVDRCNYANFSTGEVWHRRLGHLNRRSLQTMNLPVSKNVCGPCMEGKGKRKPFQRILKPRSHGIGELIHTDIAGPANIEGLNEERYYQTIIDDYSHFCEVRLLKTKSEATDNIIHYINRFENEKGIRVKKIRCDNGGEFKNRKMESFCQERGTIIQYTTPYSPKSNGVAERMNQTLYNKARTQLNEANLPKHLWGEAILCSAYQLNRCPSSAINFETPECIIRGKTDLTRLKTFGSKAWAVILPRQSKFEGRAKEGRMVGYAPTGYRLWDPETNKIIISRDVRFDESDIIYQEKKQDNNVRYYQEEEHGQENEQDENVQREAEVQVHEERHQEQSREKRTRKLPTYLKDYELEEDVIEQEANIAFCLHIEPQTYDEAIKEGEGWKEAIDNELKSHEQLNTWTETELPNKKRAIDTKWVFRTKQDGKKKARLVAKGFQTDNKYNVYSPVARMSTIRMMLSYALQEDHQLRQFDVPTAFLNGELKEEVYIKPPDGVQVGQGKVLKLNKALYGLREAPKCWNDRFHDFIIKQGFEQSKHDFCLYTKKDEWLLIWVDDIITMGNCMDTIKKLKEEFNVRDLGEVKKYIGMEIHREQNILKIKQEKMINKIIEKFGMESCKGVNTPIEVTKSKNNEEEDIITNVPYRELIGCLTYISTTSRPDITYATSYLSRYLDKPTKERWIAAKRILRYLKQTASKCLTYIKNKDSQKRLLAYSDADWASDSQDRKSVSGCAIFYCDNLISWFSKKQCTVSLSSAEAEYVAAAMVTSELIYLKGISANFNMDIDAYLLVDNQSAIRMIECNENSKRTKHIDIKFHFVKDAVCNKNIVVSYVSTEQNVADIFTKPLNTVKHNYFVMRLFII
ncbi:hypothetical protein JYU34_012939 [Plutella xylostella]|uniref:Uncharacterized protein n=1 Tax=Plutella xylostella TaxID=51655 RepID=A0ABQ7QD09_PLUXY|nr:hypothetical protein JYU34_012939 [Plutella xylostella]